MLRTTVGWSLTFVLVLGGIAACSSKSTDEGTAMGGNGTIVGGSSTTGGTTGAGTTSIGGLTGACTDTTLTCVDATTASGCNPDTGKVETFSCVDESSAIGIVSMGCAKDPVNGDSCSLDGFADQACADGTSAFAYCENATTNEQVFNIYVNCFLDNMDGHTVIPCFAKYVTPTTKTSQDCVNAEDACFPGAGGAPNPPVGAAGAPAAPGAGGAGGAGGAP